MIDNNQQRLIKLVKKRTVALTVLTVIFLSFGCCENSLGYSNLKKTD